MKKFWGWAALVAVAAFLGVFLVLPVGTVLLAGFDIKYLKEVFLSPVYREGLWNGLTIAVVTTTFCFLLALPTAWVGVRYQFRFKGLLEGMLLAPLILPPFVGALGVGQVFGEYGALNALLLKLHLVSPGHFPDWLGRHRFWAVCLLESLALYPFLYLTTVTTLSRLDPHLLEAARGLGAGPWSRLGRVVVPMIRPGLFAGGTVIFVWAFTELGTPLMLGYDRTTPVQVWNGLAELPGNLMPYALVLVMLAVATGLYLFSRLLFGKQREAFTAKGASAMAAGAIRLGGWKGHLARAPFLTVIFLAVLPHLAVVFLSVSGNWYQTPLPTTFTPAHYQAALAHAQVVPGIVNSIFFSSSATALALVVGFMVAWASVRWRPPFWQVLDTTAMLPLAIPGIILAFGYLAIATRFDILRTFLDPRVNPTGLLIIAYAVRRLPYVVRAAASGLSTASVALEEAAAASGAGFLTRLRRVTLPLMAGSLAAGAILTFSFSMLEVSDSLVLAQKRDFWPITRVIYDLVNILGPGPSIACAFATWAMLFLGASLAAAAALGGKSLSSLLRD